MQAAGTFQTQSHTKSCVIYRYSASSKASSEICSVVKTKLVVRFFIRLLTPTKGTALLHVFKSCSSCSDFPGHRHITEHSHTELSWSSFKAERDSSPLSSPGEVSSGQPWVPVQLLPLSGGDQRVTYKALCDTELSA